MECPAPEVDDTRGFADTTDEGKSAVIEEISKVLHGVVSINGKSRRFGEKER